MDWPGDFKPFFGQNQRWRRLRQPGYAKATPRLRGSGEQRAGALGLDLELGCEGRLWTGVELGDVLARPAAFAQQSGDVELQAHAYAPTAALPGDVLLGQFLLAVILAAMAGWLCIAAFLALLKRVGLMPFVIYRLLLGVVLLWILA